ncbi:CTP synthase [Spirochaeta cellobiosiphila]|uniref:CTP synthase n=1 Tax=Spirochaeta cellobiosiphila TaxID=504483 RepID=UPI00048C802F|nr:CTP synthase [Spirochaeta cellobiosiphila]
MKKYIFVTGGVCSSLGKGIAAASLGSLLECRGFTVRMIKVDPYINVDAGTMSPYQHGEVYVTDDGAETDLDLGNYSRFTGSTLNQANSITTGQVYQSVIKKEREGRYLGKTVQVIPHITDEIKQRIYKIGEDPNVDFTVIEVGGTVGDIESIPFLEAARQMIHDIGRENVLSVHLTLVPTVTGGELKTKPTQHSVKELQSIGIQPDILLCRAAVELDPSMRRKIASFTNVQLDSVLTARDVNTTIYEIPLIYHNQGLDELVLKKMGMTIPSIDLSPWQHVVDIFNTAKQTAKIALVGKYVDLGDAYKSIDEALVHGGIGNGSKVKIIKIDSEQLEKEERPLDEVFKDIDGILIPGGFGQRGIQGMIDTAKYARENKIPLLGICLGMQVMVIEYSRNKAQLDEADSSEFKPDGPQSVVSLLEEQINVQSYGGTMRLGRSETHLKENTKIWHIYGSDVIFERHRHRYEVTNSYKDQLTENGLLINGYTPDGSLVETVEWPDHPWGIGVQYHPEFLSKPFKPHPLFKSFVEAALKNVK